MNRAISLIFLFLPVVFTAPQHAGHATGVCKANLHADHTARGKASEETRGAEDEVKREGKVNAEAEIRKSKGIVRKHLGLDQNLR